MGIIYYILNSAKREQIAPCPLLATSLPTPMMKELYQVILHPQRIPTLQLKVPGLKYTQLDTHTS